MTSTAEPLDCVAFMLIAEKRILVEKRSATKKLLPGILAIPGGHQEQGEDSQTALVRELHEELNITPQKFFYVCTLLHQAEEYRRIHYYVVESWLGEMSALEAESLQWIPLEKLSALDLEIDRLAIQSYLVR
jgi:8-oxo-dGTP diphosphatase